ncbi:MAG: RNA 2'-phosphotransferase [Bacteroidaceae bacterium]|nr:RNA 2'-phosphotransferase [Bacteroidaceae bacterium]
MNDLIYNSKRLAYLLRHSKLPDHHGWVKVDVLLEELHISYQELCHIVNSDNKGRYEFLEEKLLVRALYGHSIKVDLELTPSIPPSVLYHGTAEKYKENILQEGLKPQSRNFVHLADSTQTALHVGSRHGNPIIMIIDTSSMIEEGYKFYKAQRGIWLTDCVPPEYLRELL